MRRHFEGNLLTVSSLASASGVPYGTAMRRIAELIDEGFLIKRARSKTGKSFSVHPSRKLISEFESFAMQFKAMVGSTFGFTQSEGGMNDFYFGGYYMASRILPYPNAMRSGVGFDRKVSILSPVDPTFKTLSEFSSNLDELCGTNIEIISLPLDELHSEIMANTTRSESRYDLMAFDLPWIGQLAKEGIVQPLDEIIAEANYNASDFHSAAWRGSGSRSPPYPQGLYARPERRGAPCRRDAFGDGNGAGDCTSHRWSGPSGPVSEWPGTCGWENCFRAVLYLYLARDRVTILVCTVRSAEPRFCPRT